jgi:hypothetical protein
MNSRGHPQTTVGRYIRPVRNHTHFMSSSIAMLVVLPLMSRLPDTGIIAGYAYAKETTAYWFIAPLYR